METPSQDWASAELAPWLLDAVSSMGFARMTPVQKTVIPLFMGNKDVVVEAVTGSGKTLAFLIPTIQKLLHLDPPKRRHFQALIILPTRELAVQVHDVLNSLLQFRAGLASEEASEDQGLSDAGIQIVPQLLVRGNTESEDLSAFLSNGPNVLIGTPGRVRTLLGSAKVETASTEVLVLDEADRLLDAGLEEDVLSIISRLPKQRRTGLFSASMSAATSSSIHNAGLRNPVRVSVKVKVKDSSVAERRTPNSLQINYAVTGPTHRIPAMAKLIVATRAQKTIIFIPTCAAVDYFRHLYPALFPTEDNYQVISLHGKQPVQAREKNLLQFSQSVEPAILIATDVAARGLDIPQVDLVIQEPPSDSQQLLHRCGRAGRAGRQGRGVIFLLPGKEEAFIGLLSTRKIQITPLPDVIDISVTEEAAQHVTEQFRKIVLQDRGLHDKAQRGFVSHVQAFRKHPLSSIFNIENFGDMWVELAKAWGLVRIPKMPELKKCNVERRLLDIDWAEYGYKDKQREKARKEASKNDAEGSQNMVRFSSLKKKDSQAWTKKTERKEDRKAHKEKYRAKKAFMQRQNMSHEMLENQKELDTLIEQVRRKAMAE